MVTQASAGTARETRDIDSSWHDIDPDFHIPARRAARPGLLARLFGRTATLGHAAD